MCDIVGVYAMANLKKRRRSTVVVDDYATGESSYMKMKARLEQKETELEQLCERLQLSEQRKIEVETHFEQAMKVLHGTIRQTEDLAAKLEEVRSELQQETNINDDIVKSMMEENKRLKSRIGMCRLRIEGLTTSVVNGSDSYDRIAAKVALLEETIAEGNKAKAQYNIKIKVA